MTDVKKDFGAVGDGKTNDYEAIKRALDAANTKDKTLFFPSGNYFLNKPIRKANVSGLRIYGEGATIICRGKEGIPKVIGTGGGFFLTGEKITIDNLNFEGFMVEKYITSHGYGKLLKIEGRNNLVQNCNFKGGNGGAVEIFNSSDTKVENNTFDRCNNFPPSKGNYGAIHFHGNCHNNVVRENKIFGHRYSGISGYGTGKAGGFTGLTISKNNIKAIESNRSRNHSMGIYLLYGANQNIEITENVIEHADAECVVIFSHGNYVCRDCKIANNLLKNFGYQGIALRSENAAGVFNHITISGNQFEIDDAVLTYDQQIYTERLENSIIENNTLEGNKKTKGTGMGIHLQQNPHNNKIKYNIIKDQKLGVTFFGSNSKFENNTILNCNKGAKIDFCNNSKIAKNTINGGSKTVEYGKNMNRSSLFFSRNKF